MGFLALRPLAMRLGPWLGRTAKSSPGFITKLTNTLRAGGAKVGSTIGEIGKWVKSNPGNASLLAMTMASLGADVVELFDKDAEDYKELVDVVERVKKQGELSREQYAQASNSIMTAGSASEKLDLKIAENKVDRKIGIAVLGWALGFYGSEAAAVRAHKLHQSFFEMPLDDVVSGMADFDLNSSKVERAIRELEAA